MEPRITFSPRLAEHLAKKNIGTLLIDIAQCKSCGGAIAEVFVRVAKPAEAQRLKEKPHRLYTHQGIEIIIPQRVLTVEDEVSFDLRLFFGVKDITVRGIHL